MRTKIILLLLLCVGAVEAQTHLTPLSQSVQRIWGKDVFPKCLTDSAESQFIISPSFTPPMALYIGWRYPCIPQDAVPYRLAIKNQEGQTHEMAGDSLSYIKLRTMIKHAVNTARFGGEKSGFDGCGYFVFDCDNGAKAWSPHGNAGALMKTLSDVFEAVHNNSLQEIHTLLPRIDSITNVFKTLYPEDFYTGYNMGAHSWNSTKKEFPETYCVWGSFLDDLLMVDFVIPQEWYENQERYTPYKLVKKYAPVLEAVGRYLHKETSLLGINGIYFMVNNNEPYGYDKNRKCFNVHEDDLTEERLKEIIVKEIFKR